MRVLLVTTVPTRAASEADSPAAALRDLGCAVTAVGLDLELDEEILARHPPQAIVLDVRDRLETGYACLRRLREIAVLSSTPALLATTVAGLSALDARGADDFVLVPVVPAELYARLRQLDWRLAGFRGDAGIKVGPLHVDLAGREARVRDRRLALTPKEFELLRFLAEHPNRAHSREQLLARVWGYRYEGGPRTVDIHVRRLRAKLGTPAAALIETVRGMGYKIVAR